MGSCEARRALQVHVLTSIGNLSGDLKQDVLVDIASRRFRSCHCGCRMRERQQVC